ncbi:MAG: GHKL domain-containing protein, partial [Clostridia bacterium]|nr:GHKL domain-containing protein [Clostridia bacterium]
QNLYELRLDLAKIFLKSLIVVALIALFLFLRVSIPLKKLSRETVECADKKGRILFTSFTGKNRNDEIGELSRSFSSLIEKLNKKINFSQAFSSDISHEFKNPLTAIRSSAELLESPEISSLDRKELSKAIVEEVEQLQNLLTGVRNISRIDAGQDLEESKELPVNLYISNIAKHFQKKYSKKTIHTNLFQKEIFLSIPENYLYRICDNLIGNAVSFGNKILLSTNFIQAQNHKPTAIFVLTVEDNGPGIRKDSAEKIFERFYSERTENKNTSAQDKTHTGLGLSIVKAIVDSLEGEITVAESDFLGGAKFKISLPMNLNK